MSCTVLIVEDEAPSRKELAETTPWAELGCSLVGAAADGLEGEAMIRSLEPDIVITDIRLPGQDGLEMLSRCCVSHAIILSGYTDFGYTRRAIQLGVWDYLEKPVSSEELNEAIRSLVRQLDKEEEGLGALRGDNALIELPHSVGNHIINSVIAYIASNYARPIGLQEAASYFELSESHLSRLFKEETGLNFLQYLNAWRINKASQLMADPRRNISEIAAECGFPSPGYFAKIFKRFSGMTPSQWRDKASCKEWDGASFS